VRHTGRWQDTFGTPNGELSVARLQITWGAIILVCYVLFFLRARGQAAALPSAMFINGLVVLFVGAVALLLETRIERLTDLASWPAPLPAQNGATQRARPWLDIAVLQLVLGAVVIPLLSSLPALDVVGWRMVTITIVSELVYLAFLSAQLAQKNELRALFAAIEQVKEHIASASADIARPTGDPSTPPETEEEKLKLQAGEANRKMQAEEAELKLQAEKAKLKLLQDRAAVLMRRIGRTLMAAQQSASPLIPQQAQGQSPAPPPQPS
jgi:hypothetical protein